MIYIVYDIAIHYFYYRIVNMYSLDNLWEFDKKLDFLRRAVSWCLMVLDRETSKIREDQLPELRLIGNDIYYNEEVMIPGFRRAAQYGQTINEGLVSWANLLRRVLKHDHEYIMENLEALDDENMVLFPTCLDKLTELITILKGLGKGTKIRKEYFDVIGWRLLPNDNDLDIDEEEEDDEDDEDDEEEAEEEDEEENNIIILGSLIMEKPSAHSAVTA